MVKRIDPEQAFGAIIDVQDFFLSQVGGRPARMRIERNTVNLARLLNYFRIPIVATLERPVYGKGQLPRAIQGRVAYVPGIGFYADGQGRRNLRLSYSLPEPDRIREGVRRLAGVVADELEIVTTFGGGSTPEAGA